MSLTRLLASATLALALSPGCESPSTYWSNRGSDLLDTVRIHGMFGPGVGAKLEVTRFLQLGLLGTWKTFALGVADDEAGYWRETIFSWGLLIGAHYELEMKGVERVSGSYGWVFLPGEVFKPSDSGEYDLDIYTIRGTAMLVVGLDLELRMGEIYDFIVGFFTLDPAGDDIDHLERERKQARQKAAVEKQGAAGTAG